MLNPRRDFARDLGRPGGQGEIRTHGTREGTTVFETVPIDHSGTSPRGTWGYSIQVGKSKQLRSLLLPTCPVSGRFELSVWARLAGDEFALVC